MTKLPSQYTHVYSSHDKRKTRYIQYDHKHQIIINERIIACTGRYNDVLDDCRVINLPTICPIYNPPSLESLLISKVAFDMDSTLYDHLPLNIQRKIQQRLEPPTFRDWTLVCSDPVIL